MPYLPRAPRRPPRPDEMKLLRAIAEQPLTVVDQGPIGRCVKRGWCVAVYETNDGRQMNRSELPALPPGSKIVRTVGYLLTDAGRRAAGLPRQSEP